MNVLVPCAMLVTYVLISTPHCLTEQSTPKVAVRFPERLPRTLCLLYRDASNLGVPIKKPAGNVANTKPKPCQINWHGSQAPKGSRFSRRQCSAVHNSDSSRSEQLLQDYVPDPEICKNVTNLIVSKAENLWPDGIIYYRYSEYLGESLQKTVIGKFDEIEYRTCLRFKELPEGEPTHDYVLLRKTDDPCQSDHQGRKGGQQVFDIGNDAYCRYSGGVLRHLLRVAGLGYAHNRPDRNFHISIHWENINEKFTSEFCRSKEDIWEFADVPYDVNTVMHYSPKEKNRTGGRAIDSHHCINNFGLSFDNAAMVGADVVLLNRAYNCKVPEPPAPPGCTGTECTTLVPEME